MERELRRRKGDRWCSLEIRLEEGRLSICGSEGRTYKRAQAKREAKAYWRSFFEESPGELAALNQRFGRKFGPSGAAQFVLDSDGELHGLDVSGPETGDTVDVVDSCGQIRDSLLEFFPEVEPFLKWHLNDLHAGCEHQEALAWGRGKTIALSRDNATPAQLEALDGLLFRKAEAARKKEFDLLLERAKTDPQELARMLKRFYPERTITLFETEMYATPYGTQAKRDFEHLLKQEVARRFPVEQFKAQIFEDCLEAPCPECGYRYGTQWLKRDLPAEVKAWAENFPASLK